MASLKKLLDEHVAAGDAKPAAVQNAAGTVAAGKFAPKPRAINAQEVELLGFGGSKSGNVDPGWTNPCLLIWGCPWF